MSKERAKLLAASTDLKEMEESLRLFRLHLEEFPADEDTRRAMQSAAQRFGLFVLAHQQRDVAADCLCRLSLPDQDIFPALARLRDAVSRGKEQGVREAVSDLKRNLEACLRRAWGISNQANLAEAAHENLARHPDLLSRLAFSAPAAATVRDSDQVANLLLLMNDSIFQIHKDKMRCVARNYIALWSLLSDNHPPPVQPSDDGPGIGIPRKPKPPVRGGDQRLELPSPFNLPE